MRPALLSTILAALAASGCKMEEEEMCLDVEDDAETCPAPEDVDLDELHGADCDNTPKKVLGEGRLVESAWDSGTGDLQCCYPVRSRDEPFGECVVGRPFLDEGGAITACVEEGPGWSSPALPGEEDEALCQAFLRVARMEHASIAAFARLTLELMALAAPAELLAEVQQAAADEVEHARLCFSLASRFAGRSLRPGPFPFSAPILPRSDLAAVAADATREGCIGETIGAFVAAASAARATDPALKQALARIARDEARHAALSWRIVGWAVQVGGAEVRAAVARALAEGTPGGAMAEQDDPRLERQGVFGPVAHAALCQQALREVVGPAARVLLAA